MILNYNLRVNENNVIGTRAKRKNVKIVKSNISTDFFFIENILNILTFKGN